MVFPISGKSLYGKAGIYVWKDGAAARLSNDAFQAVSAMKEKMADALAQVADYGEAIRRKYGDLNLQCYAVVFLGYERI